MHSSTPLCSHDELSAIHMAHSGGRRVDPSRCGPPVPPPSDSEPEDTMPEPFLDSVLIDLNDAPPTPDPDNNIFSEQEDVPPSPPSTISSPYQSTHSSPTGSPGHPHPLPLNNGARPQTPPLPVSPCHSHCPLTCIQDLSRFAAFVRIRFHTNPGYSVTIHQPPFHQRGPKNKWYYNTRGTAVGVWNSW